MNHKLYALFMMILPIPLLIAAEQIWTKRKDWLLEPKELAENADLADTATHRSRTNLD
jgi:hypothetical protein